MGWTSHYNEKMKVVTNYMTKPQHSFKQAFISFLVNHGPQILVTSVSMVRYVLFGHVFDPRAIKPTLLAFLVVQVSPKRSVSGSENGKWR